MNTKGQGLSVNVIIVAVLALLVLVVIAFIFTGKIGQFAASTNNCEDISASYTCEYSCNEGYTVLPSGKCLNDDNKDSGKVCCIPVTE